MSFISKLAGELDGCVSEAIINREQCVRIMARAQAKHAASRMQASTWITIIAGLSFALGISLICAYNWDKIPPLAKVLAFNVLLLATGEAALALRAKHGAWALAPAALWFFMPAIGIGLYAQVFQLSGDPVKPFFAWAMLSLPLALWWEGGKIAFAEAALLVYVLFAGAFGHGTVMTLSDMWAGMPASDMRLAWLSAGLVIAAGAYITARKLRNQAVWFAGALLVWIIMLTHHTRMFHCADPGMIMFAAASAALVCIGVGAEYSCGETGLPFIVWFAVMYGAGFLYKHDRLHGFGGGGITANGIMLLCGIYAAAAAFFLFGRKPVFSADPRSEKAARIIMLLFTGMLCLLSGQFTVAAAVAANIVLFGSGAGLIWHGMVSGNLKHVDYGVTVVTVMLFTRFLDYFGSMLTSGSAFIAAGCALAMFAYFIRKGRKIARAQSSTDGGGI
ncbi:MAG: DUF2157 domain-containing protein [Elusimicrobiales bacterium]